MSPLSSNVLPGFPAPRSRAPWPVWKHSAKGPIRFVPLSKKQVIRLWHAARAWDRATHQPGRHGGAVGHAALQVLHTLIFDFLNHTTGRLDPSYAAIARKSGMCQRTVASALRRLRDLGILNWVRRCAETWRDGRFSLEQDTNAYGLLLPSQWRGYRSPEEPPPPAPGTWGDPPRILDAVAQAAREAREGGDLRSVVNALGSDPSDPLARALERLGRVFMSRNS